MIKTWQQRLSEGDPRLPSKIVQGEIDELRKELAKLEADYTDQVLRAMTAEEELAKLKASNSFVRERAALEQEWCAVRALQRAYQLPTLQDDRREGLTAHHVYCRAVTEDV